MFKSQHWLAFTSERMLLDKVMTASILSPTMVETVALNRSLALAGKTEFETVENATDNPYTIFSKKSHLLN